MQHNRTTPLYDAIGTGYDITRRPDPYIASRLAHHLALHTQGTYLDMACGTGNYTTALAMQGGHWHGLDQSRRMLRTARQKAARLAWCQGNVTALPFPDTTFSGVLCTLAIHHFAALLPAFTEAYRVLASGRLVIFTSTPEQMRGYWLNAYFPDAMAKSMVQMPTFEGVQAALIGAGFWLVYTEPYEVRPDLQDFFLYSGKYRPAMYLSEAVRQGISTFAALADAAEVRAGCARLQADIAAGRIAEVMQAYTHTAGDYLFVVATKGASG